MSDEPSDRCIEPPEDSTILWTYAEENGLGDMVLKTELRVAMDPPRVFLYSMGRWRCYVHQAADRLNAAMLHIEHLEALAAQIRALPADTDEIPGLRRELKSLKRQAGEYLGEARPDALRESGGGE